MKKAQFGVLALGKALQGTNEYKLDGSGEEAADPVTGNLLHLRVTQDAVVYDYWVDVQHGALPVRETVGPNESVKPDSKAPRILIVCEDLRQLAHDSWLPFRVRTFTITPGDTIVRDFSILSADMDSAPKASEFVLELPEPQAMIDQARKARYEARRVWDLSKLPRLGQRGYQTIAIANAAPDGPDMPGVVSSQPRWARISVFIGGLLLTASVAVIIIRRMRRAQSTET